MKRSTFERVADHLDRAMGREDGLFLPVKIGQTATGLRLIAQDPVLPAHGDWELQGHDQLRPSATFLSRAASAAISIRAGLIFVHSHPDPTQPADLSPRDRRSIRALANTMTPIIRRPLGAIAVHPDGWSGEIILGGQPAPIERVTAVGRTLEFLEVVPEDRTDSLDDRQRPMLGRAHPWLRRLHVGIVGAGGIGSPLAETVVRMGVSVAALFDRDVIDDPSGVRRIFGSSMADLNDTIAPRKVDVVGRHLEQLGFGTQVRRFHGDVRSAALGRALLDCDVVLCGTDSHGSRATLNDLAVAYGLPLIDVGVRAGIDVAGSLAQLVSEVRTVTWDTPCLWCLDVLDGRIIREENLPPDERAQLVREGYAVGRTGRPEPSSAALTVLAAGQAACALLALLSDRGSDAPSAYLTDALNPFLRVAPLDEPRGGCRCRTLVWQGDDAHLFA
jgi:ThiF family